MDTYVCVVCGYEHLGDLQELPNGECPECGVSAEDFEKVED